MTNSQRMKREAIIEYLSANKPTPSDFLDSDLGLEKLDSICMQLNNIGEALKVVSIRLRNKTIDTILRNRMEECDGNA